MKTSSNYENKQNNIELSPPWDEFFSQVEALFGKDPDVDVLWDEDNKEITLLVDNTEKAEALMCIMPTTKEFGNITVHIRVVPANVNADNYLAECFEKAFRGNEAFSHVRTIEGDFVPTPINFCSFKKEVVQYPNDNPFDENGVQSTLYQELAKEIFGDIRGIFFCTDKE